MPACYQCNGNGRCKGCSCTKAGKLCTNCLPGRRGQCSNLGSVPSLPSLQSSSLPPTSSEAFPNMQPTDAADVLNSDRHFDSDAILNRDAILDTDVEVIITESPVTVPQPRNAPMDIITPPVDAIGECQDCSFNTPDENQCRDSPTTDKTPPAVPITIPDAPPNQQPTNFRWGSLKGVEYKEVIHWRQNVFLIPSGSTGKAFVSEIARLFQVYADSSSLESSAMKAITVLQVLLLQKPSCTSKSSDHVKHLKRRLDLWQNGDIHSLTEEGRCLQEHIRKTPMRTGDETIARTFCKLMMEGKVHNALNYLSCNTSGGVLKLEDLIPETTSSGDTVLRSTYDILHDKHPQGKTPIPECLLYPTPESPAIHPILYDNLNGDAILQTALHTQGAAGPAGLDAYAWRRMCTSFKSASRDLCQASAEVGRRICTTHVHPEGLEDLLLHALSLWTSARVYDPSVLVKFQGV